MTETVQIDDLEVWENYFLINKKFETYVEAADCLVKFLSQIRPRSTTLWRCVPAINEEKDFAMDRIFYNPVARFAMSNKDVRETPIMYDLK